MPQKIYSMPYASHIGTIAIKHVTAYLERKPQTTLVQSVEKDKSYQTQGIDLLWNYVDGNGNPFVDSIEVKGDRHHESGNYFFETVSNKGKNTEGCFLYSKADFLYYYFLKKELHIIPLLPAREWFLSQIDTFPEKSAATATAAHSETVRYYTTGRLVECKLLRNAVKGVFVVPYRKKWDE